MKTEIDVRKCISDMQAKIKSLDKNDVQQYFKIRELQNQILALDWTLQDR